ncbi:MAG: phosphatase PAP2 family protein [Planctomycetota bacterium]|nr:MAG: phosphatase PAP2 family protein [Planctomycetota bacterium]
MAQRAQRPARFRRFGQHFVRLGSGGLQLARKEPLTLATALLAALALLGFLLIANAMAEGSTQSLDARLVLLLRHADNPRTPVGPPWLAEAMRDVSALGSTTVLALLLASVFGYLMIQRRRAAAWTVLWTTASGLLVSRLLKLVFTRERPDVELHLARVVGYGFPSGHSMQSAVAFLTLAAMLARMTPGWRGRLFVLGMAMFLTVLVGTSRVFLGVHYPTDVVAGWAAGLAWALICWLALTRRP